ncbi:MipA/OmpV family protein [Colwelliaceae bacterium 6441]
MKSASACQTASSNCTAIGDWQISIALGAGVTTNPLHSGDNFPLFFIPYIHYYDENFYIENNTLGYSFYQSTTLVISAVFQLNREKMFFTDWQPSQLLVPNSSESFIYGPTSEPVTANEIKKRQWAIDAGIQMNWFINDDIEIKAQLLHDINHVYNGYNANIRVNKRLHFDALKNSQFNISFGAQWQSEALANYYYGLAEGDKVNPASYYHAGSGIQPFISFSATHKLNAEWQVKLFAKKEFLDNNLSNSPLVEDNTITSAFIGVVYAF